MSKQPTYELFISVPFCRKVRGPFSIGSRHDDMWRQPLKKGPRTFLQDGMESQVKTQEVFQAKSQAKKNFY